MTSSSAATGRSSSSVSLKRPAALHQLVGELLRALAREARLAGGRLDGLRRGGPHRVAAAGRLLLAGSCFVPGACFLSAAGLFFLSVSFLAKVRTSLSSPAVTHLHPTADLAERALLPDDPGQALALTRVLFDETPRMFNHHRGLWGYSGIALDGAPLTVQSTGIGGPSAAIVVAELHALGLRRAVRIGRAWALDGTLRAGELVAATAVLAADGASRALGAGARVEPDAGLTAALRGDRSGADRVGRRRSGRRGLGRAGLRPRERRGARRRGAGRHPGGLPGGHRGSESSPEDVAERLGRGALPALAPLRAWLTAAAAPAASFGARRLAGARFGVALRSAASSLVIASSEPWRPARRSSRRSTPSSMPSRRWETDRRRRVRRSMSEADGMFNAPKATSWACAAFSRASKARAMAPLMSGFSSRSWASRPRASSPDRVRRSRRPSPPVSSSMRRTLPQAGRSGRSGADLTLD